MQILRSFTYLLLTTTLLTSCGSFIEVQHNPFEMEADAIRSYKQKRKNRPDKSELAAQKKTRKAKPAPSRQQYFGRDKNWTPAAALFPDNQAKIITDSEPLPSDEPLFGPLQTPSSNPKLSPNPTQPPPSSATSPTAPIPQHKPVTSGNICYSCNGKGYVFSPGTGKSTLCEKCEGSGKR